MTPSQAPTLRPGRTAARRRPRLVAIDVDQTLLRSDRTLAPTTVDAVSAARAAGIEVTLASSRAPGGLWSYLDALGLVAPASFVGFQGALVGSFDSAGTLSVRAVSPLPSGDALVAADAARSLSLATNWYTPSAWFVDELTEQVQREADIVAMTPRIVSDLRSLPEPAKLLFIAERPGQLEELISRLPPSVTAETSNSAYLEITAHGVDKATGVAALAAQADLSFSRVVAIGDGRNDLGLFRRVGTSIALANADPAVRAEADYVGASNDEDGVALALQWLACLPEE